MERVAGYIGKKSIQVLDDTLNLCALFRHILILILKRPVAGRAMMRRITLQQIYFTAVQALWVILPIAVFVGSMIFLQFSRISEHYDMGKITVIIVIRELGPMITAFLVILRSATAVTIEISYMNIQHETETLEMAGIDPVRFIGIPRLIGITTAIASLFAIFDLAAIGGGFLVAWSMTHVPIDVFFKQIAKAITASDILVGLVKAVFFGILITLTSIGYGFREKRQITEVPGATSRSAVRCIFYCIGADVLISALFYL